MAKGLARLFREMPDKEVQRSTPLKVFLSAI